MSVVTKLRPFDPKSRDLNVIIETPRGCRNTYSYDEKRNLFKLGSVLPLGAVFPFDFGFIPRTVGEDGDPLDVLVLMDEPAFSGRFVAARLLGVIEATQTEDGKTNRNDLLIAISANAETQREVKSLTDLNKKLVDKIEHFFVSYNSEKGKTFSLWDALAQKEQSGSLNRDAHKVAGRRLNNKLN